MEQYIKDENGKWIPNPALNNENSDLVPLVPSPKELIEEKKTELEKIKKENQVEIEKIKTEHSETVTVNKHVLDGILDDLKRLKSVADVGRLGQYDDKNKAELKRVVLLSTWDGKVIVGWKMTKDDVQKVNGIWREFQLIQIKLEDDTTVDLPYLQFSQEVVKVDAEIISRTKEGGHETLKVLRKDNGKEIVIDVTFVN